MVLVVPLAPFMSTPARAAHQGQKRSLGYRVLTRLESRNTSETIIPGTYTYPLTPVPLP